MRPVQRGRVQRRSQGPANPIMSAAPCIAGFATAVERYRKISFTAKTMVCFFNLLYQSGSLIILGVAENAGPENAGMKMQHMKLQDNAKCQICTAYCRPRVTV